MECVLWLFSSAIASKPKIRRSCGFEVSRNAPGIWLAGEGEGGLGRSWNWPMHKRFYFLRRHIVWSGGTLAHQLIYFFWWPANNDFSWFPFAGILEEKPIKNILNDEYFSSITDEMEMSWKSKHDGKSVNESLKEYLVEYVGKPITDLFRYVSRLWHQLLW